MEKEKVNVTGGMVVIMIFTMICGIFLGFLFDQPKNVTVEPKDYKTLKELKTVDDKIINAFMSDELPESSEVLLEEGKNRKELIKKLGY